VNKQLISIVGSPGHGSWTFRFNQMLGIPWHAEPLSVFSSDLLREVGLSRNANGEIYAESF